MSYSRNFGMRSFENIVRMARFRAPASGTAIKIGAPVVVDPASPNGGFFKRAGAAEAPTANAGLAIYEHIQNKSDALTTSYDSPYDLVPLGQYAQIMRGPGVKVWFLNTPQKTMYDGRVREAGGLLAGVTPGTPYTGLPAQGDGLVPDGAGGYRVAAAGTEDAWMIVENVNPNTGVVEARLTF